MALYAKTEQDLKRLNRIAKKRASQGLAVDPVDYSGELGRYTMVYDGEKYVPEFTVRDTSLLVGFDAQEFEKLLEIYKKE